ncbi:MAG: hypothetical protein MUC74_00830 [Ideonella sp.]|nr:hypothetical protein [Ideonella sp.]
MRRERRRNRLGGRFRRQPGDAGIVGILPIGRLAPPPLRARLLQGLLQVPRLERQCPRIALGHLLEFTRRALRVATRERLDGFVAGRRGCPQQVTVAVGHEDRPPDRQAPDHARHLVGQPPVARDGGADFLEIDPENRERRLALVEAWLEPARLDGGRQRLHQLPDLRRLGREVILDEEPPEVLHDRQQEHHVGVVAGRPNGLRGEPREAHTLDQVGQRAGAGLVEWPGPGAKGQGGLPHPAQSDQGHGTPQREHRTVAGDLAAADLGGVHLAEQLEAQREVLQDLLGDLLRALLVVKRQSRHALDDTRQARQVADAVQAIDQQAQGTAVVLGQCVEPALQRTQHAARRQVALAGLAIGCTVGDGTQGLWDGMGGGPGQAQGFPALRRQSIDRDHEIVLPQRRLAREQAMQQHAAAHDVSRREGTLATQPRRVDWHRALVGHTATRVIGRGL